MKNRYADSSPVVVPFRKSFLYSAECGYPSCSRYFWGVSQREFENHAYAFGWTKTPYGWLCRSHAAHLFYRF